MANDFGEKAVTAGRLSPVKAVKFLARSAA
jgi:hypothetical protein